MRGTMEHTASRQRLYAALLGAGPPPLTAGRGGDHPARRPGADLRAGPDRTPVRLRRAAGAARRHRRPGRLVLGCLRLRPVHPGPDRRARDLAAQETAAEGCVPVKVRHGVFGSPDPAGLLRDDPHSLWPAPDGADRFRVVFRPRPASRPGACRRDGARLLGVEALSGLPL